MLNKLLLLLLLPRILTAQLSSVQETWQKDPALKNASISFYILNLNNGEELAEYNSNRALVPASTLKILSTAAALSILGPDFKYETKIYFSGNFDKNSGVLNGDLIIAGSGDPSLQSENFYKEKESVTQ